MLVGIKMSLGLCSFSWWKKVSILISNILGVYSEFKEYMGLLEIIE